jgi:hypothetical protein
LLDLDSTAARAVDQMVSGLAAKGAMDHLVAAEAVVLAA